MSYIFTYKGKYWYISVTFQIIATVFSLTWDYKMDWGLLRSSKRGKFGLRETLLFPPHFYYMAMFVNLILRFVWIMSTSLVDEKVIFGSFEGIYFLLSFLEAFRRAQWSIFRVENENVNNFEKYRSFEIPKMRVIDMDED